MNSLYIDRNRKDKFNQIIFSIKNKRIFLNKILKKENEGYSKEQYLKSFNDEKILSRNIASKKNIHLILLNEDIFIEIIKMQGKENSKDKIEEVVFNTFYNYETLIHHEKIEIHGENYLIVYFVKYDENIKYFIKDKDIVKVSPYQFINKNSFYNKIFKRDRLIIHSSNFKETTYFNISYRGEILYSKLLKKNFNINDEIDIGLKFLEEKINIKNLKIEIAK